MLGETTDIDAAILCIAEHARVCKAGVVQPAHDELVVSRLVALASCDKQVLW